MHAWASSWMKLRLSERSARKLGREVDMDPRVRVVLKDIANILASEGTSVRQCTKHRCLNMYGLHGRRPRRVSLLTRRHVDHTMTFAQGSLLEPSFME
jgi:hypothetical protein